MAVPYEPTTNVADIISETSIGFPLARPIVNCQPYWQGTYLMTLRSFTTLPNEECQTFDTFQSGTTECP